MRAALLCAAGLVAGWLLYTRQPGVSALYPPCLFKRLTGLDCPGCGSLRGLHALLHGRLADAVHYNLLLLPALMMVALYFSDKSRWWQMVNKPKWVLVVVLAFFVLRNLPVGPLQWLHSDH
jgi:hypothetical protein